MTWVNFASSSGKHLIVWVFSCAHLSAFSCISFLTRMVFFCSYHPAVSYFLLLSSENLLILHCRHFVDQGSLGFWRYYRALHWMWLSMLASGATRANLSNSHAADTGIRVLRKESRHCHPSISRISERRGRHVLHRRQSHIQRKR